MKRGYYHTKKSVDEYTKLAAGQSGAALIEKLCKFLPDDSFLLEIGSGPGTDWDILNKNYKVTGSDNSTEFLNRLKIIHPEEEFIELNAATLDTDRKFAGIYSNKVLHHLSDEEFEASIKRQYDILTPGGIICHSFWEGEGDEVFNGLFVNNHSEKSLKKYFNKFFHILLVEYYAEFEDGDSIVLLGKKK